MKKIVELKTHRSTASPPASDHLRALQELQRLCANAIDAGGLDEARTLDFTVAVHRALNGSEWNVRFYQGKATGL